MGRLSGKRAIVTGAGSGIGRASARLFAAEGAALVIVDKVEAAIDETAEMIRKDGGTAISVAADVSDETAVQGFVELCAQQHGGVDVLFANAGISGGMVPLVAGLRANAGATAYSASKAGVISLVQTVANEFYGSGVRVNAICPGLIETGMTKPIFDGARARGSDDKIGQLNPMKRYGLPPEIAHAALFLASDDASYVNGQAIAVDGGLSSTHPFAGKR